MSKRKISFPGKPALRKQEGSITILFCIFATVLLAALSLSLYIGQEVRQKIQLQNASDNAALAMASHQAQGLNMVAANNLAIAASLHIAGSFTMLSSYLSFAYIFTADGAKAGRELLTLFLSGLGASVNRQMDLSDVFQKDVWNALSLLPATFLQSATGMTSLNTFLKDKWLAPAPLYGIEVLRTNHPVPLL